MSLVFKTLFSSRPIYSLPKPDVVVAHFREAALNQDHIQAADVVMLIEVAESSYDYDHSKPISDESGERHISIISFNYS